jgi:hypothetical protein
VEHFSSFYLKIALFQESGEKIMCSERVKEKHRTEDIIKM